jgi:hypothetical protein
MTREFVEIYKWMFAKTLNSGLAAHVRSEQAAYNGHTGPAQRCLVWVSGDSPSLRYTLSVSKSFVYIEGDKF